MLEQALVGTVQVVKLTTRQVEKGQEYKDRGASDNTPPKYQGPQRSKGENVPEQGVARNGTIYPPPQAEELTGQALPQTQSLPPNE
jgi:hypothetical protein